MLILTFEEFNNKFNNDNNAMSDIRIKDIGKDISVTPIENVMRDENPKTIRELNFNIIVNLHPTDGSHWVSVIRREGDPVYYFNSFGVETPPLFLEDYVDLGSNERIQQYDESFCGVYCLYMICLIYRGFRFNNALNVLVNQCKYPGIYICFCLGCHVNVEDNVNDLRSSFANQGTDGVRGIPTCSADNDNVNVNDLRSSFANNDNDNLRSSLANQGTCFADNDNDDNFIYVIDEKHQKGNPSNVEPRPKVLLLIHRVVTNPTNNISVNINGDLQPWLNDDNIITEATIPENFRCIIYGPSECGKTFLLK